MTNFKRIIKNIVVAILILNISVLMCFVIYTIDNVDEYVHMITFMSVLFVARFTDGYLYGLAASVFGVFMINYAFTYPYFEFNVSLAGYPVKFFMLLSGSIVVSTLTTQIKSRSKVGAEAEKEKIRANLLRSMSHDIRTPLTSIIGSANAILENSEKIPEDKKISLVKDISDEAEWLIRIVENILSITRMSNGKADIKKTSEAAEEIMSEAVYKAKKQFPDITVKTIVPDELIFVPMDATLIEQVVINLIENAVIHGHADQICFSVVKNSDTACFTVSDNGTGIPKEKMNSLFNCMDASECGKGDMKRNMGIGLSVCMSIVVAHGGTMVAYNKPGGGAAFEFTLPTDKEEQLCQ